jgi:hypothetical protein
MLTPLAAFSTVALPRRAAAAGVSGASASARLASAVPIFIESILRFI